MAAKQKSPIGTITRNYIIALAILALLSIIAFFILLAIINTQTTSAAEINISGRQRMLSQRIALFSLLLVHGQVGFTQAEIRNNLNQAINLMEKQHQSLIEGNKQLNLPRLRSPQIRALFFQPPTKLDKAVKDYLSTAKKVATASRAELTPDNPDVFFIVNQASSKLLQSLDKVVAQFQKESEATISTLLVLQTVTLATILLVLFLEGLIIFSPMARRIREEAHELVSAYEAERNIASTLQKTLAPEKEPKIKNLEIKLLYQSATVAAEVGGDFYDFFELANGSWGVVMGDVAGKGIEAAAETAKVKYLLRDRAYRLLPPEKVLASINTALIKQKTKPFTALTFGVYNPENQTLNLTNAGNPYPYLTHDDRFLEITNVPIALMPKEKYSSISEKLEKGDGLFMFTDGLVEARKKGELFGEERVRDFIKKNINLSLQEILEGLLQETRKFSGNNLTDDILIIGLRKIA